MSEILFIADQECVLALIGHLQPQVETSIHLETDYTSGVKRIFDSFPSVVFLQGKIGELTCDKLAYKVKLLLDGQAVPLILLAHQAALSHVTLADYEACFDLGLPGDELNRQVQSLLQTLPGVVWKAESTQSQPGAEESTGTIEITFDTDAGTALSWSASEYNSLRLDESIFEALPCYVTADAGSAQARQTEDCLADPATDLFASATLFAALEPLSRQEPEGTGGQPKPQADLRSIERSNPSQLFGSMSESFAEPAGTVAKPVKRPVHRGELHTGSGQKSGQPSDASAGPTRLGPAQPAPAGSSAPPAVHDLPDSVASALGIKRMENGPYQKVVIGTLLALVVVVGAVYLDLFSTLHPILNSTASFRSGAAVDIRPSLPAPLPPAAPQLPQFVLQVPPDLQYAASHPGWERYPADAVEYLVFREQGRVRAVQVLGQGPGAISPLLFKTCVRDFTGTEQCVIGKTELRGSLRVESGHLPNGAEFQVYRKSKGAEILGFVLTFPEAQPPTEAAQVSQR